MIEDQIIPECEINLCCHLLQREEYENSYLYTEKIFLMAKVGFEPKSLEQQPNILPLSHG